MRKTIHSEAQSRFTSTLREIRDQAGLTQSELAARLRRPQSFVSKIETGERRVDLSELEQLCEELGVSLLEFVTMYEQKRKRPRRSR